MSISSCEIDSGRKDICVKKLRFQGQVQGHRVKVLGRKINNNVCDSKSIMKCLC